MVNHERKPDYYKPGGDCMGTLGAEGGKECTIASKVIIIHYFS